MLKIQKSVNVILLSISFLSISTAVSETDLLNGVVNYKKQNDTKSIYGNLNCKGSTNVGVLLKQWVSEFKKIYPLVESSMDFKGSSQGIQGLIEDTATIGATSRPIREKEIEKFKKLKGYTPTEIKVSLDALAIYVNRLNKIDTITLDELDAIFSKDKKREYPKAINSWQELDKKSKNREKINIYLFDKNSGTRSFFRHKVMLKGAYNKTKIINEEYTTTTKLLNAIANDKNGIGFGSIGVQNFKVKTLALSKHANYPTYKPSSKNIKNNLYPLTRFFYIYLDVPPNQPIPKMLYEFCKFILSHEGQTLAMKAGGLTLSPQQIGTELSKMRRE